MNSCKRLSKTTLNQIKREQECINAGYQWLVCGICGKKSMGSLISHITRKHKISMDDYRSKHPDHVVQQSSPSTKVKNSQAWHANPQNAINLQQGRLRSYPSLIEHWLYKGYSLEEARSLVSKFQKEQSLKGNNPRTREKRSKKNSGQNNPMSLSSIAKRFNVSLDEASRLTPCFGRCGELHPMFGQTHTQEALLKIANAHHLHNPSQRSVSEMQVAEFVKNINENVKLNVGLGRWNVDILDDDNKIIIEYFGCMWHAHHCMNWKDDFIHPIYNCVISKITDRNERKILFLKNSGYTPLIIWECDWNNRQNEQKEKILNAYNRAH